MRLIKLLPVFLLLSFVVIFSCRKTDVHEELTQPQTAHKFFDVPSNLNPVFYKIAAFIKRQDAAEHFIDEFSGKEGLPQWKHAFIVSGNKSLTATGRNSSTTSPDTIAVIPLVLDSTEYVNSFITCKVNGDSISIKVYRGRRYAAYGFSETTAVNANDIASQIMAFNYTIFGDSIFRIKDKRRIDNALQNIVNEIGTNPNPDLAAEKLRTLITRIENAIRTQGTANINDVIF